MKLTKLLFLAATLTAPLSAFAATDPTRLPEPVVLGLFGLGAAVAIALAIRKGRR